MRTAQYTQPPFAMSKPSPLAGLLWLCLSLWLSACGKPEAQTLLEDYADSMSNVLATAIPLDFEAAVRAIPALPEKRQRTLDTPDMREGMLDVWDFQQCGMMHLIAERNSSLGKVMLPSQKMRYELRFLAALQRCLVTMQALSAPDKAQQDFIARLLTIAQLKQQNLAKEIWNGLYRSDEISQHFARGQTPLPLTAGQSGNVLRALTQLHTLAGLHDKTPLALPAWLDEIEAVYYAFYSSEFGAQLLPALAMLTHALHQTAVALETRLQAAPFCHSGHRPRRAEILRNIFQKYYAGQVQPYMALIQREGQEWLRLHDEIMHRLPAPKAMQAYQQRVLSLSAANSLWRQWETASRRHTRAWQEILGQCEMMPGPSRSPG